VKTLTLFLSALMLWGYSLSAAADPSCEGRFVNPITDVCWRCIFPLSLGSVQVGKGDLPDTSNPGSPLQLCPAPPPLFVRPGLAIGEWGALAKTALGVGGADGHDGRQPFARLYGQSGGL